MTTAMAMTVYNSVVTAIQGLTLDGLQTSEVQLRKVYRDTVKISRGVTVSPGNTIEGKGTNATDDWGYGMLIYFVAGTGKGYSEDIDRMTLWREQVRKLFHNKRISAVPTNNICTVAPGDAYITKEQRANQDVSALLLRPWTRETRN